MGRGGRRAHARMWSRQTGRLRQAHALAECIVSWSPFHLTPLASVAIDLVVRWCWVALCPKMQGRRNARLRLVMNLKTFDHRPEGVGPRSTCQALVEHISGAQTLRRIFDAQAVRGSALCTIPSEALRVAALVLPMRWLVQHGGGGKLCEHRARLALSGPHLGRQQPRNVGESAANSVDS